MPGDDESFACLHALKQLWQAGLRLECANLCHGVCLRAASRSFQTVTVWSGSSRTVKRATRTRPLKQHREWRLPHDGSVNRWIAWVARLRTLSGSGSTSSQTCANTSTTLSSPIEVSPSSFSRPYSAARKHRSIVFSSSFAPDGAMKRRRLPNQRPCSFPRWCRASRSKGGSLCMGQLLLNPVRAAVGQSDQDSAVDRWRYPRVGGCAVRRTAFVRGDTHRHGEGGAVVLQRGRGPCRGLAAGEGARRRRQDAQRCRGCDVDSASGVPPTEPNRHVIGERVSREYRRCQLH